MTVAGKKGDVEGFKMDDVTLVPMDALKEQQKPVEICDVPTCKDTCIALMEIRDRSE